ncbi:MAG TPA: GNAT family N-acetyltransferase [archaeon]|nr:GNAT family N-acetyltransferase [archaeon]
MPAEIEIRHCRSLEEFKECVRLERLTWGEAITVPAAIFVVAEHSGGQILGAFDGGRLVGFTLGLAGFRPGQHFIHSHMTTVLPEYQNRGVGRRLKLFQRQDALKRGIPLVEWTFDPLEPKNAHFNLVRLGAIARRYIPDCYGVTESPLHAGLPTDRLVAEWWLDSERVKGILADDPLPGSAKSERIAIPADVAEIKSKDRATGERVQQAARAKFLELFEAGWVATSIESTGSVSSYILEPAGEISGLRLPEFHEH